MAFVVKWTIMILSKARFSYLCQKELYQTKSSGSFHCYVLTRISSSLQPSLLDEPRHSKHERLFSFHEEKRIFSIHKSLRRLCTIHYLLSNSMVQCTYAREFQYKEEIWFNQKQEMVSFWPFGLRSLFFSLSFGSKRKKLRKNNENYGQKVKSGARRN